MSDAYRTATNTCPSCSAPLREFAKRLVCDTCEGMLLATDDFVRACEEVATRSLTISFRDEEPARPACPRCAVPLVSCKVTLGDKKLKTEFLRCDAHGIWCGPDVLPGVFAIVGRTWGISGAPPSRGAGSTHGLDGLPVPQHRAASGGLAISAWHQKRRKRPQTATPIDAYRDLDLACPACPPTTQRLRFAGDRWTCGHCNGAFVQRAALEALVEEMAGTPYDLAAPTGSPGPRACPVCVEAMLEDRLASVTIDRCEQHGLWFDQHELQTALVEIGLPEKSGLVGWLKKLF